MWGLFPKNFVKGVSASEMPMDNSEHPAKSCDKLKIYVPVTLCLNCASQFLSHWESAESVC